MSFTPIDSHLTLALESQTHALPTELDIRLHAIDIKRESRVLALESRATDSDRALMDFSVVLHSDVEAHLTAADVATDSKLLQNEAGGTEPEVTEASGNVKRVARWGNRGFRGLTIVPLSLMTKSRLPKWMVVPGIQTTPPSLLAIWSLENFSRTYKPPTLHTNYQCF